MLVDELAAHSVPVTSMQLTRLQAVMILGNGLVVRCWCGWLIWPTGGISGRGRPLHTLHALNDVAGAVRRLTRFQ